MKASVWTIDQNPAPNGGSKPPWKLDSVILRMVMSRRPPTSRGGAQARGISLNRLEIVGRQTPAPGRKKIRPGRTMFAPMWRGAEATLYLSNEGWRSTGSDGWSGTRFVHTASSYSEPRRFDHRGGHKRPSTSATHVSRSCTTSTARHRTAFRSCEAYRRRSSAQLPAERAGLSSTPRSKIHNHTTATRRGSALALYKPARDFLPNKSKQNQETRKIAGFVGFISSESGFQRFINASKQIVGLPSTPLLLYKPAPRRVSFRVSSSSRAESVGML